MLPYVLILPELLIILIFFYWPSLQAFYQSFHMQNPFGLSSRFVWFRNYITTLTNPLYMESVRTTAVISFWTTLISMVSGLFLAWLVFQLKRKKTFQTLILWPYALAPAVAGVVWFFIFNPTLGVVSWLLSLAGKSWDPVLNGKEAMLMVVMALSWKQISYNFLFFLTGLLSIPKSLIESGRVAGASTRQIFFYIAAPLLAPVTFFLLTMNLLYTLFDSFGAIHNLTSGGPNHATENLVYKVYSDGFLGLDMGGSAAQSVIIMILAIALTTLQFRFTRNRKGI